MVIKKSPRLDTGLHPLLSGLNEPQPSPLSQTGRGLGRGGSKIQTNLAKLLRIATYFNGLIFKSQITCYAQPPLPSPLSCGERGCRTLVCFQVLMIQKDADTLIDEPLETFLILNQTPMRLRGNDVSVIMLSYQYQITKCLWGWHRSRSAFTRVELRHWCARTGRYCRDQVGQ